MQGNCPVCGSVVTSGNVCEQCGYKLLEGTAQFDPVVSSVMETPITQVQSHHSTKAYFQVVSGPQRGVVIPLTSHKMTIGRDPYSDIFLNDMTVSRQHAVIAFENGAFKISDCNSFNGLWVNNKLVNCKKLIPEDRIQLGAFTLIYKEEEQRH